MNKTPSIPAAFKLRLNLLHYMYYLSIVNPLKYEVYRYRDPEYVNSFGELNNKDCVHRKFSPTLSAYIFLPLFDFCEETRFDKRQLGVVDVL